MSSVGMAGSVLFGWIADRVGGKRGLVILTTSTAVLWLLLTRALPEPALVAAIALQGLCAAGAIPNLSRVLAEAFGTATFSRSFGLATTVGLPLNLAIVLLVPWIRAQTGNYVPAMLGVVVVLAIAFLLSLYACRSDSHRESAVAIA